MIKSYSRHKAIQAKIENFKNIELNALPVYDDRYIKSKKTYGDKVYTNFSGLNMLENNIECKAVIVVPIDSLLVYMKKNITCKYIQTIALIKFLSNKLQIILMIIFLKIRCKCCIMIELILAWQLILLKRTEVKNS